MEKFDENEELKDLFLDVLGHVFRNDADGEEISFGFEERKPEDDGETNEFMRVAGKRMSGTGKLVAAPAYYRYLAAPSYESAVEIDKKYRPVVRNVCGLKTPLEDILYVCITKDYSFGIGFTVDEFHLISPETGHFSISYDDIEFDDDPLDNDSIPYIEYGISCEKIHRDNVLRVLNQLAKLKEDA